MMHETVNSLIRRYGQEVEVHREGEMIPSRAFLQPILDRRDQKQQKLPTALGLRREDRFLYLGQPQVELEAGMSRVRWMDELYQVQTAHPIYIGKGLSHWWAVLVPADEEEA